MLVSHGPSSRPPLPMRPWFALLMVGVGVVLIVVVVSYLGLSTIAPLVAAAGGGLAGCGAAGLYCWQRHKPERQ